MHSGRTCQELVLATLNEQTPLCNVKPIQRLIWDFIDTDTAFEIPAPVTDTDKGIFQLSKYECNPENKQSWTVHPFAVLLVSLPSGNAELEFELTDDGYQYSNGDICISWPPLAQLPKSLTSALQFGGMKPSQTGILHQNLGGSDTHFSVLKTDQSLTLHYSSGSRLNTSLTDGNRAARSWLVIFTRRPVRILRDKCRYSCL
jgi:hypothetical protein